MKCPKCKADISEDSHFCSKCGMPLRDKAGLEVSQTKTIQKPAISSGKTIAGKYKIIREIGRGEYFRHFPRRLPAKIRNLIT